MCVIEVGLAFNFFTVSMQCMGLVNEFIFFLLLPLPNFFSPTICLLKLGNDVLNMYWFIVLSFAGHSPNTEMVDPFF